MTDKEILGRLRSFGFALLSSKEQARLRVLASQDPAIEQELRAQKTLDGLLDSGLPGFPEGLPDSERSVLSNDLLNGVMSRLDSVQKLSALSDVDIDLAHQVLDAVLPRFDSDSGSGSGSNSELSPKLAAEYARRRLESPELRAFEEAQVDAWMVLSEGMPALPSNLSAISRILESLPAQTPDQASDQAPAQNSGNATRAARSPSTPKSSDSKSSDSKSSDSKSSDGAPARSFKPAGRASNRPIGAEGRRAARRAQGESAWPAILALLAVGGFGLFLSNAIRSSSSRDSVEPPVERPLTQDAPDERNEPRSPGPIVPPSPSSRDDPRDAPVWPGSDGSEYPVDSPADGSPLGEEPILAGNDPQSQGAPRTSGDDRPGPDAAIVADGTHAVAKNPGSESAAPSDAELESLLAGLTDEDLAIIRNRELLEVLDMLSSETGDRKALGELRDSDLDLVLNIELLQSIEEEDWE